MARKSIAVLIVALLLALTLAATALADREGSLANNKDATWAAHITTSGGILQGEVWLQETPCELGTFFSVRAPQLPSGTSAILRRNGTPICTVPSSSAGGAFDAYRLCFVLEKWPADQTEYPPDPGEGVVWFRLSIPASEYLAALRAGEVSVVIVDEGGTELLEGTVR